MSNEEVHRLNAWREELVQEVVPLYQTGDRHRGSLAFGRWKERFLEFLKKNYPGEASTFVSITTHMAWLVRREESAIEEFMREDGRACLAFIDDLIDAVSKGRIRQSSKDHKAPQVDDEGIRISRSTLRTISLVGRLLIATLIVGVSYYIYSLPQIQTWEWLQNHPNRLGLYLAAVAIISSVVMSLLFPSKWKFWLGSFGLSIVAVLIQIVGR